VPNKNAPFHPIIYVRGYAMTQTEIDQTTADPFCGFNLGSTVYRAVPDKTRSPRKYIFESPIMRLASEFQYQDVYEDGYDILDPEWHTGADGKATGNKLASRSLIIFRYYDEASTLLGIGETPPIGTFATRLGALILRVRDLVCANKDNNVTPDTFRCYLVAHSMGGLVCRAFLQNPQYDNKNARQYVDKLFTYATPHNGIEMGKINVPSWLGAADTNNFNREKMAAYLNLEKEFQATGRVDWIPESRFPADRIFCMVGSNRMDYEVAFGLSRTFVGHGSDGLVRIENATLNGIGDDGKAGAPCAKAVAFRAHSGYFGIVNSEEAFQNLIRFLFGDVRVDMWVDVDQIRLPEPVQKEAESGHAVNALYQFEIHAAPRGKLWYLTRRTAEEDSVACLTHKDWTSDPVKNRSQFMSTAFLANRAKVNPRRRSLAYSMTLGVRVPDYEIDRKLWVNEHYEGTYLFRDTIIFEMSPPANASVNWKLKYRWHGTDITLADEEIDAQLLSDNKLEINIPFGTAAAPGIKGKLRLVVSLWNTDADLSDSTV
jgi:hypothetical protein